MSKVNQKDIYYYEYIWLDGDNNPRSKTKILIPED